MTKKDLLKLLECLDDDTKLTICAPVKILGHITRLNIFDLELEDVSNEGKFATLRGKW